MADVSFLITDSLQLLDDDSVGTDVHGVLVGDEIIFFEVIDSFLTYSTNSPVDAIDLSDSVIPTVAVYFAASDSLSLGDSIGSFSEFKDSLNLVDAVSFFLDQVLPLNHPVLVQDGLLLFDSVFYLHPENGISLGESLAFSDAVRIYSKPHFTSYLRRYLNDVPTPSS